jgi:branched-chain amino acid transport system substrate-binding protein
MKNNLLFRWILIPIFLLTFGTASTTFGAETIKIGIAGAHTGDLASYGLPMVRAAELVVKKVNAQGGISGKKAYLGI